ncbi:MAG: sulfurtransferase [Acidobacteriota bacterium]
MLLSRTDKSMIRYLLVLLAAGLGSAAAPPPAAGQASAASPGGLLVSTTELAARLKEPDLVLLHIADRPASFEDGHIPGARFVRYGDFAIDGPEDAGSELPPADQLTRVFESAGVSNTSRVVLYGTTVIAARAFFTLDAMGLARVQLLDGGLRAWRAENRPIETGAASPPAPGRLTATINQARVASAQQIQQQMPGGQIALIDVRPDAEFLGTDGGMGGAHAAGHIAGARQLPWDTLVATDGRFLPRDQLQARLASVGAAAGKPVVAYCMVGMRASVVYFVARHLGYDAKLYDGSIVDWSHRKLPTVLGRQ